MTSSPFVVGAPLRSAGEQQLQVIGRAGAVKVPEYLPELKKNGTVDSCQLSAIS
jgi:hypothetical protein